MTEQNQSIIERQDKLKQLLIEEFKRTPITEIACKKAGVSRATLYRWKSSDKEFARQLAEALNEGRQLVNDLAESQLISAIKDRNLSAVMYWLKVHHADYKNRLEIEGTINTIQELSPEQQALVKKALDLASSKLYGDQNQE
ncbi:MAG: phBC6A51 family helix-turn-helix protein [Candidatus Parcubacteria bacterium]|nr:phBC6A51 family helix-turn-helix protein [Candidatus Parcubacteria bacterium]